MSQTALNTLFRELISSTPPAITQEIRFKMSLYDLLNVLAVRHNLRPGAILASVREDRNDSIIKLLNETLFPEFIKAKRYPMPGTIILVRKDRPDLVELMDHLNKESPEFDTDTGKILGYFTPFNIHSKNEANLHAQAVEFLVTVAFTSGVEVEVHHFPQRVSTGADVSALLEDYRDKLFDLPMPAGLRIKDVTIKYTVMPTLKTRKRKNKRRNMTRRR